MFIKQAMCIRPYVTCWKAELEKGSKHCPYWDNWERSTGTFSKKDYHYILENKESKPTLWNKKGLMK